MADDKLKEKLADYVEDAHAMEQNDLKMIDSMISTTDDPQMKEMLEDHKRETEEHERRLRARLDAMGRGTSARKQVSQRWGGPLLLFPFNGPPLFLLTRWRSWVVWSGAILNFRFTAFYEVRIWLRLRV
jgi:hypothetical protein